MIAIINEIAEAGPNSQKVNACLYNKVDSNSVVCKGPPCVSIHTVSKLRKTNINLKIAATIIAGVIKGRVIYRNLFKWPAPSIQADSFSSFGTPNNAE